MSKKDKIQTEITDVDEIMRKYDRESNTRIWEGIPKIVVGIILALFSLFCIYVTLFANFLEQVRLSSFLGLVIVMGYLTYPAKKGKMQPNYMPWYDILLMVVGSAAFFYYTFNAETLLNTGLKMKLQDPVYIIPLVIVVALWTSLGTSFLSFIAGLQTVDKAMYEAGAVEGIKNRWQELWYITLPAMKPQLMFGAVMQITSAFSVSQISLDLVGFPSVNYAGHTIMTHLHDFGNLRYEMGYACTIAVFLFLLMLFCNILVQKVLRKIG